jgi:NAD(P)-dependent dehydrogenase (short-subunit alcohol dehydrogenase family)
MARITTPFDFSSTAADVITGIDLSGRRAVVTGGGSGIGIETARTLAGAGADVTLAVRRPGAAEMAASDINAAIGSTRVRVAALDVADQDSVDAFVRTWRGPLHLLINNAGVMALPALERTVQGWEMQFATNHLGHLALATGLQPALAQEGARIVALSSSGHLISPVVFDDINFNYRPYDPLLAYGQSKTATVLFAVAATNHWARDGITANAVMPGAIATNLQRHTGGLRTPAERRKTPQQGAATTITAATSPLLEGIGGRYLEDNNEAVHVHDGNGWASGVAPYALDPDNAERLWTASDRLLSTSA